MSTPAQRARTAAWVRRTVSVSAQQPVPGSTFPGSMPAPRSSPSSASRSSTESELASLVVPKTASPAQPCERSQRQWRTKRAASGDRSERNGVRTGASTPERRVRSASLPLSQACLARTDIRSSSKPYVTGADGFSRTAPDIF